MALTVMGGKLTECGAAASTKTFQPAVRRLARSLLRAMSEAIPQPIKRFSNRYVRSAGVRMYFMLLKTLRNIAFSRTQAFALPTDLQEFIRLNLPGQEPERTVPPQRYDS